MFTFFDWESLSGVSGVIVFLGCIFVIAFSIMLHEVAHAFVALKCGDDTAQKCGRISFNPAKHFDVFGTILFLIVGFGYAKPVPINPSKFKNFKKDVFMVSFAGIATNLLIAFVSSFLMMLTIYFAASEISIAILQVFAFSFSINITLAVFNLLPIYPLDGFNMLSVILKPDSKFLQFMVNYGSWVLIAIIVSPLFSIWVDFAGGIITKAMMTFWGVFI